MFRITQNISIPNISQSMAQGGRMSFPVDPASLIYSHFEHVYGRAAPQGTEGVAISQLKLLNVLIGQLAQTRTDAAPPLLTLPEIPEEQIDAAQVDVLINTYREQILQTMEASAAMPYLPSPSVQSGAVLNLVT